MFLPVEVIWLAVSLTKSILDAIQDLGRFGDVDGGIFVGLCLLGFIGGEQAVAFS